MEMGFPLNISTCLNSSFTIDLLTFKIVGNQCKFHDFLLIAEVVISQSYYPKLFEKVQLLFSILIKSLKH